MQQSTTSGKIGSLLIASITLTIIISYIPTNLALIRQTLSLVQFVLMTSVMIVAVRALLRDF